MASCDHDESKAHRVQFEKIQEDDTIIETTPHRGGLNMYVLGCSLLCLRRKDMYPPPIQP